jgi:tetratricopeptide (TPR) repeat protein
MVYFNLGLLYEKKGQTERALEMYQEAVRLQPGYGPAYYHLGLMLENLRRADAAREAYGKAIERSPDLVEAHFRYGVMSYMAGEMENAMYSLSRVKKLAPYSLMASDARKYLDRLQGAMGSGARSSSVLPSERISHLEVVNTQDLQRQGTPSGSAQSSPAASGTQERSASLGGQKTPATPALARPTESKPQAEAPAPPPPGTHWTYIVQVGSFLDKENAEELKQKLKSRGFDVSVKPLQHQVLGQVYIVQFNPVDDEAKASTLMAQVGGNGEQVKPILIKIPASN